MSFMVNKSAWDQLPATYQEAFRLAALWAAEHTQTVYDTQNPAALNRLIAGGTQLRRFSQEIMVAARNAANDLMEENAAADPDYRRVYDAWKPFREASFHWFGTSEKAYADFAFPEP
jgi:TRAP-type mannitol/chloroaromatic compound transport system substrate-binding protein